MQADPSDQLPDLIRVTVKICEKDDDADKPAAAAAAAAGSSLLLSPPGLDGSNKPTKKKKKKKKKKRSNDDNDDDDDDDGEGKARRKKSRNSVCRLDLLLSPYSTIDAVIEQAVAAARIGRPELEAQLRGTQWNLYDRSGKRALCPMKALYQTMTPAQQSQGGRLRLQLRPLSPSCFVTAPPGGGDKAALLRSTSFSSERKRLSSLSSSFKFLSMGISQRAAQRRAQTRSMMIDNSGADSPAALLAGAHSLSASASSLLASDSDPVAEQKKKRPLLYVKVSAFDGEAAATFVVDEQTSGWHLLVRMILKLRAEYPLADRMRLYYDGATVSRRIDSDDLVLPVLAGEAPPYHLVMRPARTVVQALVSRLEHDLFFRAWFDKRFPAMAARFGVNTTTTTNNNNNNNNNDSSAADGNDTSNTAAGGSDTTETDVTGSLARTVSSSSLSLARRPGGVVFSIPTAGEEDYDWCRDGGATLRLRVCVSDVDADTHWLVSFSGAETIRAGVQRMLLLFRLTRHADQFGFYSAEQQAWLDAERCFADYQLPDGQLLYFDKLYASYAVALPDRARTTVAVNLPAAARVATLLRMLEHNFAALLAQRCAADYGLFFPGELDEAAADAPLSHYAYGVVNPVEYRLRQQPLVVFRSGHKATVDVDYLAPLRLAEQRLCAAFGLDPATCHYVLQPLHTIGTNIDVQRSLAEQGFHAPATLALLVDRQSLDAPPPPPPPAAAALLLASASSSLSSSSASSLSSASSSPSLSLSASLLPTVDSPERVADSAGDDEQQPSARYVTRAQLLTKVLSSPGTVQQTFLVTYPHVLSHDELCAELIAAHRNAGDDELRQAVADFVVDLVAQRSEQLRGSGAGQLLTEFLQFTVLPETTLAAERPHLLRCIRRLTAPSTSNVQPPRLSYAPLVRALTAAEREAYTVDAAALFAVPELELAMAITAVDQSLFQQLTVHELASLAWQKQDTTVQPMVTRFNALCYWVAFVILEPRAAKQRAQRFDYLVRVAEALRRLNNFQSLMAFVSGFHSSPVARLNLTRQHLSPSCLKALHALSALMQPEGNWAAYRAALKQAKSPVVPFIGNYLADLTFAFDGNPTFVDGLVNWSKLRMLYTIARTVPTLQKGYLPRPVPDAILPLVAPLPQFNADDSPEHFLFALSLTREPRRQAGPGSRTQLRPAKDSQQTPAASPPSSPETKKKK